MLDERFEGEEQLFFGSGSENVDLSTLHPDQPKMFKLWQIYLENVDPLLKVTHTITLQARVEAAANNITSIEPNLEALMFSMYCVAVHSLRDVDCRNQFGLPCKNLLGGYHFACRRALMNCGIFRSDNFDGLTALCLYLVSLFYKYS